MNEGGENEQKKVIHVPNWPKNEGSPSRQGGVSKKEIGSNDEGANVIHAFGKLQKNAPLWVKALRGKPEPKQPDNEEIVAEMRETFRKAKEDQVTHAEVSSNLSKELKEKKGLIERILTTQIEAGKTEGTPITRVYIRMGNRGLQNGETSNVILSALFSPEVERVLGLEGFAQIFNSWNNPVLKKISGKAVTVAYDPPSTSDATIQRGLWFQIEGK